MEKWKVYMEIDPHEELKNQLERERQVRRQLAEALRAEQRAARLCAYGESLPDGVTTEAFAEAANLRRGSAAALAAHDALDDGT